MASLKKELTPEKMLELLNSSGKMNLSKIALKYHVSRQRVHQIYSEYKQRYPEMFKSPPDPKREEIEQLLVKNLSLSKIANRFGISVRHLKKLMSMYELKKVFIKDKLTPERLTELYVNQGKNDREIAEIYSCSPNTVMRLRYTYGIYEYMRKSLADRLTRELFYELYVEKGLLLSQIARLFKNNIQNIIRLKNDYGIEKHRAKGVTEEELQAIKDLLIKKGVIPCD